MGVALPILAIAATIGSAVVGAAGASEQAQAQSQAANYNAQVAQRNAQVSLQNASLSAQAGNQQVENSELKNRAVLGSIKANEGASGVDINSGSFKNVQASEDAVGQQDALTIRSNAVKEAYGYQTQAQGYEAQGSLDTSEAANDKTAGNYSVASTLLGGAGSTASKWEQFQLQGALGGGSSSGDSSELYGD